MGVFNMNWERDQKLRLNIPNTGSPTLNRSNKYPNCPKNGGIFTLVIRHGNGKYHQRVTFKPTQDEVSTSPGKSSLRPSGILPSASWPIWHFGAVE